MRLLALFGLLLCSFPGKGQFDHEPVFPGSTGNDLLDQLVEQYKPETVLDFSLAKDVLYGEIYLLNDSVRCVYSGHALYLPENVDPSSYLYFDGISDGINAEHTFPKSMGADSGNAESDLYNLFPSRVQVNSDRGNLPFGEIPDDVSDFWYYLSSKSTLIPTENIDLYSELGNGMFEPREDHKGNVARAVFYFFTMYNDEVTQTGKQFFEGMRSTLCDWHYLDPVDSLEWNRNLQIAAYQSGKPNPFILDCSLAGRTYCDTIDPACTAVSVWDPKPENEPAWSDGTVVPNPAREHFSICFEEKGAELTGWELFNPSGQTIIRGNELFLQGSCSAKIQIGDLLPGIYFLSVKGVRQEEPFQLIRKLIIHP